MPLEKIKARAREALAAAEGWSYTETPWTDVRDGEIRRAGRATVVAHIPQTEDGEAIIEMREALRALLGAM